MFSVDLLRELYLHMEWADATVWHAALASDRAAIDEPLRDRLLHMHVVQRAFLQVWTDHPVELPETSEFSSLSALEAWARPYYGEVRRYLETVDGSRLAQPLTAPWVRRFERQLGRTFETPMLADTLFQVTSHSTYHRGQVNSRLRELGVDPPLVDYIAWVWFGKPAADWARS